MINRLSHSTHHRPPASPCPNCHKVLDGAANTQGTGGPQPGDATVCLYCATILLFDAETRLRLPAPDELEHMKGERDLWRTLQRIQQAIRQSKSSQN